MGMEFSFASTYNLQTVKLRTTTYPFSALWIFYFKDNQDSDENVQVLTYAYK